MCHLVPICRKNFFFGTTIQLGEAACDTLAFAPVLRVVRDFTGAAQCACLFSCELDSFTRFDFTGEALNIIGVVLAASLGAAYLAVAGPNTLSFEFSYRLRAFRAAF